MPLYDSDDPVVRAVLHLRDDLKTSIRTLGFATAALFAIVVLMAALSLYIRSHDLENLTKKSNEENVRVCFRDASQRQNFLDVAVDPSIPNTARSLALTLYENAPTIRECRDLANRLHVSVPRELG